MEYNKRIADMRSGDEVEGFYILKGAFPKTTAAGKPFLSASLSDTSGVIDAKVWDYTGPIGAASGCPKPGARFQVHGFLLLLFCR